MVSVNQLLAVLAAAAVTISAVPTKRATEGCENKLQRRAWHTLSDEEKAEYIKAEQCLMKLEATAGLPVSRSKFDELQENHQIQATVVHHVGAFLPYHRYLMWTHEHLLREECGYTGAQPYWYEQMDAGKFSEATILDPELGFGGDGRESDGCITDGPFKDYENCIGPGFENTFHCVDRNISNTASEGSLQSNVDKCNEFNTFEEAWPCIEGAPHSGGHIGIGLEMSNPISSPGDPIFYLHHTWLDKVWWDWQAKNLSSRLYDISGRNTQDPDQCFPPHPAPGVPCHPTPSRPDLISNDGDPGNITTLNHVLDMMGIIPNVTIEAVMDIGGPVLCYEYIEPEEIE